MKILFSPSETKLSGGVDDPLTKSSFFLPNLFSKREEVISIYMDYIKKSSLEDLSKLFGIKKLSKIDKYKNIDLFKDPTLKTVQRYTGIAYDYLDYNGLSEEQKEFIDNNLIIFSNLFGPLRANDQIPYYKLKQGEKIGEFSIQKYYRQHFSDALDSYFQDEFIVDLRAGFYTKFYDLKKPFVTMKFIKNSKVVSHWAKAYRGTVVKKLAKHMPQNEESFSQIAFENLSIIEIRKCKLKTEYIYEIGDS